MKTKIEVYDPADGKVIHTVDVTGKSDSQIERVERGMSINMDPRYTTRVVRGSKKGKKPAALTKSKKTKKRSLSLALCTPGAKTVCAGMKLALAGNGERALGFYIGMLLNIQNGTTEPVLAYRMPKGGQTIVVNHCPWCGNKVR